MRARLIVSRAGALALLCALATHATAASASTAWQPDEHPRSAPTGEASHPAFVGELRTGAYVRSNDAYFDESKVFGWPVSGTAAGIRLDLGAEVLNRFTLAVSGSYWGGGAQRRYARLMLTSESLLLLGRLALVRFASDGVVGDVSAVFGGGRYWLRETYSDPTLFAKPYVRDAGSLGFASGVDAALSIHGLRLVVGYAYHYAPASVANDLGAAVRAGGHELSFGVGARI